MFYKLPHATFNMAAMLLFIDGYERFCFSKRNDFLPLLLPTLTRLVYTGLTQNLAHAKKGFGVFIQFFTLRLMSNRVVPFFGIVGLINLIDRNYLFGCIFLFPFFFFFLATCEGFRNRRVPV